MSNFKSRMVIDDNIMYIDTDKRTIYKFNDEDKLYELINENISSNLYNLVNLNKSVTHKNESISSILKVDDFQNENGVGYLKIIVKKPYLNIVRDVLYSNEYTKVNKNITKTLK